jgi:hypothetical protein
MKTRKYGTSSKEMLTDGMDDGLRSAHRSWPSAIKHQSKMLVVQGQSRVSQSLRCARALGRVSRVRRQSVHPSVRRGIPPSFARANEKIIIKAVVVLKFVGCRE